MQHSKVPENRKLGGAFIHTALFLNILKEWQFSPIATDIQKISDDCALQSFSIEKFAHLLCLTAQCVPSMFYVFSSRLGGVLRVYSTSVEEAKAPATPKTRVWTRGSGYAKPYALGLSTHYTPPVPLCLMTLLCR